MWLLLKGSAGRLTIFSHLSAPYPGTFTLLNYHLQFSMISLSNFSFVLTLCHSSISLYIFYFLWEDWDKIWLLSQKTGVKYLWISLSAHHVSPPQGFVFQCWCWQRAEPPPDQLLSEAALTSLSKPVQLVWREACERDESYHTWNKSCSCV